MQSWVRGRTQVRVRVTSIWGKQTMNRGKEQQKKVRRADKEHI